VPRGGQVGEAERGELIGGQQPVLADQADQVTVAVRCADASSSAASSLLAAPGPAPRPEECDVMYISPGSARQVYFAADLRARPGQGRQVPRQV
jgi:hypothetical protein